MISRAWEECRFPVGSSARITFGFAISARDLIVVKSVVMLLVFAVVLVNFLVDLAYAAIDPRVRRA